VPSQVYSNGFCFNKCPSNYSPYNALCLQNCPLGFTDLGHTCVPPSVLRQSIKSTLEPCGPNEVDRAGNCFEPQVTTFVTINGQSQPRVIGCGCIRKSFGDRVQCPAGFKKYNNGCVTACPPDYFDIVDAAGNISSQYCSALCPLKKGSQERWASVGNQCVKEYISNSNEIKSGTSWTTGTQDPYYRNTTINVGLPNTVLSYLASRPLGSSLNDRVRVGQTVGNAYSSHGLGSWASDASSWGGLINDPIAIVYIIVIIGLLFFLGPTLLPLLGTAVGTLFKAVTEVTEAVAVPVAKAAGQAAAGAIGIATAAENAAAASINKFASNTAA
jgi:hypothetical protein